MTGYLIESYRSNAIGKPSWFRLFGYVGEKPKPEWTEDPNLALRFGRPDDAAWIALLYPEMCCLARITEHIWG